MGSAACTDRAGQVLSVAQGLTVLDPCSSSILAPNADLNGPRLRVTITPMKLALATVVYVLIGLILGWGILALMHGSYWILVVGLIAYTAAFIRYGCLHH